MSFSLLARVRWGLAALVVAGLLMVAGSRAGLAQGVGADDLPIVPDPSDCAIERLTEQELLDLYVGATPEAVDLDELFAAFEAGASVDDATSEAVTGRIVELLACANAGDFLAVLAGSTEAAAVTFFGPESGATGAELEAELAEFAAIEPEALPEELRITLNAVIDVREMRDGLLGALIVSTDPETLAEPTLDVIMFEEAGGEYLLAGFLNDPYGLTPGYPEEEDQGTPTP